METHPMPFEDFYQELIECLNEHCLFTSKQAIGDKLGYSKGCHIYNVLTGEKKMLTRSFYNLLILNGFDPRVFIAMLRENKKLREKEGK
jgi:hypothetical protein